MAELESSHQGSYDRGVEQGKVLERLEGHDEHFRRINGSIDRSTDRLASLESSMDQLVNLITNSSARSVTNEERGVDSKEEQSQEAGRASRIILMLGVTIAILLAIQIVLEIL
jgi:hypothetical protein